MLCALCSSDAGSAASSLHLLQVCQPTPSPTSQLAQHIRPETPTKVLREAAQKHPVSLNDRLARLGHGQLHGDMAVRGAARGVRHAGQLHEDAGLLLPLSQARSFSPVLAAMQDAKPRALKVWGFTCHIPVGFLRLSCRVVMISGL
eukprot:649830-Rhodomonas_salina.1